MKFGFGVNVNMFLIEDYIGIKDNFTYNRKVTFFVDDGDEVEAEYYYFDNRVNWLISFGFEKGSLGEMRKQKAHKVKKPYFSFKDGWFK